MAIVPRKNIFTDGVDIATARGLEIGPLDKPIVGRGEGPITYVDHLDTPALRRQYALDRNVDIDAIHVDVASGHAPLPEALAGRGPFDYIIASHVVEHVPDLVGWLRELEQLIAREGQIRLAVPDRRFTFDFLRAPSTLAEVLDAYQARARVPQPRAVLDYYLNLTDLDLVAAWRSEIKRQDLPRPHAHEALDLATRVRERGDYMEIHAWVFTPQTFATLMQALAKMGLLGLRADLFIDSRPLSLEFFVGLRRHDDPRVIADSWAQIAQAAHAHDPEHKDATSPAARRLAEQFLQRRAALQAQRTSGGAGAN